MAEFITKCPHCQNDLQVEDEWDGMDVDCPICSKTFTVRKPSVKRVKNNSRTSSAHKYYCSNCKKDTPNRCPSAPAAAKSWKEKFCSECDSKIQNKSSNGAKKAAQADNPDNSCFWDIAVLIGVLVLFIGVPVLLTIWIDWPRTIFWCTLPLWGICLGAIAFEYKYKKLAILLFAGIIWWGWWAHTRVEIPTPEQIEESRETNQAPAATSAQANNIATEINVSVCLYNQLNEKKIPAWRGALFNYDSELNDAWLPAVKEIEHLEYIENFNNNAKAATSRLVDVDPIVAVPEFGDNAVIKYRDIMRKLTPIKTFATREETITLDDIPNGTYLLVVVATYGEQEITWQEKIVKNNSKNMSIKLSNDKTCLIL